MNKITATFTATTICVHAGFAAMRFSVGDSAEWTRMDVRTLQESTIRTAVISSGTSDSLPADSGTAWQVRIETATAQPETLELFQFKDGGLRWTRPSTTFPVEFESPKTASRSWKRGVFYWALPNTGRRLEKFRSYGYSPSVNYDTSSAGKIARVQCKASLSDPYTEDLGSADVRGLWTDSVGPVWQELSGSAYFLKSRNGIAIASTPLLDSLHGPSASVLKHVAGFRYPQKDDRYVWVSVHGRYSNIERPPINYSDTTRYEVVTTEAPEDSAGWIRRGFTVKRTLSAGTDSTWSYHERWDSLGNTAFSDGCITSESWTALPTDSLEASGAYYIRYHLSSNFSRTISSSRYMYMLPTGEQLVSSSSSYQNFTGAGCTGCVDEIFTKLYLVSSPSYSVGVRVQPTRTTPTNLSHGALTTLLATDPGASVRYASVSGRSGSQRLDEFMATRHRLGVLWVQVTTTNGRTLRGLILDK